MLSRHLFRCFAARNHVWTPKSTFPRKLWQVASLHTLSNRITKPEGARANSCSHSHSNISSRNATQVHGEVGSDITEADIVIVGGGIMGSSTAFFLSKRIPEQRICVVEKDFTYCQSSTVLSAASIRQQFSLPENILMSMYGYQFIMDLPKHLGIEGADPPDVQFRNNGYLFLASEEGAETLQQNHKIQKELGADIVLLTASQLKEKFPWMNVDGVSLATLGMSGEGYFDAYTFLQCFKKKAQSQGVQYINAEVCGVSCHDNKVTGVQIQTPQGTQTLSCKTLVNAAGPSGQCIAEYAGLDLPVEPRKRSMFIIDCPKGPSFVPLMIDYKGEVIRHDGGTRYLTLASPTEEDDAQTDHSNLDVDQNEFMEKVWPPLAERIPVMEELKVLSSWAGYYEFNTLDHNAIIGPHTEVDNFFFINGFSGHGLQQAAAAGRALSELIIDGSFQTIDLTRLSYDRISEQKPLFELNII